MSNILDTSRPVNELRASECKPGAFNVLEVLPTEMSWLPRFTNSRVEHISLSERRLGHSETTVHCYENAEKRTPRGKLW